MKKFKKKLIVKAGETESENMMTKCPIRIIQRIITMSNEKAFV
jgi:hypothetical protein